MMRAILLASATRTSIGGLRATMRAIHEPAGAPLRATQLATALAPMISRRRRVHSPIFEVAPSFCLPPVECWSGVSPTQAAKSRPRLKLCAGGAKAVRATAVTGPTPGTGHEPARRLVRLGSLGHLPIQNCNLLVEPVERVDQDLENGSGDLRERLVRVLDGLHELRDMRWPFGDHDAELGQMLAQGIDGLGPLPHQEIARPEHKSGGLGLLAFGSHEAHVRALGRLADRLGIRGIVLLALHERLDVIPTPAEADSQGFPSGLRRDS